MVSAGTATLPDRRLSLSKASLRASAFDSSGSLVAALCPAGTFTSFSPHLMEQAAHGSDIFNTNRNCDCEYCKSYRDAVNRLVDSFSSIPSRWIENLDDAPSWMPMWGTIFRVTDFVDIGRMEKLLQPIRDEDSGEISEHEWQEIADTGVYGIECDGEFLLGIDGAGYDFYENHWLKLYDALDYHWHTPVPTPS